METNNQINKKLSNECNKQEKRLENDFLKGNENLKKNIEKIKKDMELMCKRSNVNYDIFTKNPEDDFKKNYNEAILFNKDDYMNQFQFKNIVEKPILSPSHYRQESTSEITIERTPKINNLNYKELKNKLSESSGTTEVIFPKSPRDVSNSNNIISENDIISNKVNLKKLINNTAPLKNQKIKKKIIPNSFLKSKNIKNNIIKNDDFNLKIKNLLDNQSLFDINKKKFNKTRNNNRNGNLSNSNPKVFLSQELFDQTNKGNYNTHYNTNYNTNYNTTVSNINNLESNSNNQNNIVNIKKSMSTRNSKSKQLISNNNINYKRNSFRKNKTKDIEKEYITLKNEINLLKKQKQFIKNSIDKTNIKKKRPQSHNKIKNKNIKKEFNRILDYNDLHYFEKKIIGKINEDEKDNIIFSEEDFDKDDFGKYIIDKVINKSVKGYKYRHCNNCSRLLVDGKSCYFCQKRHHKLNI